jgi:hypothetical protein
MTTRGDIIDRVVEVLGDTSAAFRTYLEGSFERVLYKLWDRHDWNFKHKVGNFPTVIGTESYDIATTITDLRSSEDIEVMYNKTKGRVISKTDLKNIRKSWPKEDTSGEPTLYAPWGGTTIYLSDNPDAVYDIHILYLSNPIMPIDDEDDLLGDLDIPVFMNHIIEDMLLIEGFRFLDDGRLASFTEELNRITLPLAIQADMKHLETTARIKFWQEELAPQGATMNDYLRHIWWGEE